MILFLTSSPTGPLDNSRYVDGIDDKNYHPLISCKQDFSITGEPVRIYLAKAFLSEARGGAIFPKRRLGKKTDFQFVHLISGIIEQQISLKKHYILMM